MRVRLTEHAVILTERASVTPASFNKRASKITDDCASRRSSLRVAQVWMIARVRTRPSATTGYAEARMAEGISLGRGFGPRRCAVLCGRRLTDEGSIQRGYGSECESDLIMAKGIAETDSFDPIEAIRQPR